MCSISHITRESAVFVESLPTSSAAPLPFAGTVLSVPHVIPTTFDITAPRDCCSGSAVFSRKSNGIALCGG